MSASLVGAAKRDTAVPMAAPKATTTSKPPSKMHRRSRSGCFTCRLRRKKCDEGKPMCRACRHLGLKCEYKRPMWWSNNEQRRAQKETVKGIIRRTKVSEKTAQMMSLGADTPPSLSHSVPTSDAYSDMLDRTRDASVDSQFAAGLDAIELFHPPMMHPAYAGLAPPNLYSPYDVDVKTERQMYVNDIPTRRDSSLSTFSACYPAAFATIGSNVLEAWPAEPDQGVAHEGLDEDDDEDDDDITPTWPGAPKVEPVPGYFDFAPVAAAAAAAPPPPLPMTTRQAVVHVDELDRPLLDHFINNVLRLIFPVFELNRPGSARDSVVLPALETNRCYLHCCLSVAALHMKATLGVAPEQVDQDVMRHRAAAITELCEALQRDTEHDRILDATLAMIFFQCAVGRPDDCLPDIPWHQHFQAASNLAQRLELPRTRPPHHQHHDDAAAAATGSSFGMALTSWIDILGATMLGRAPVFADAYRDRHLTGTSAGLCELMGCDDRIMYLISEMACLEALKLGGMDDMSVCEHVHRLATAMGETEPGPGAVAPPYSATGALRPRQLARNLTAVFRLAARIYLCSLIPGFDHRQPNIVELVRLVGDSLDFVPAGPDGFDRALVWPYLIAGAASTAASSFRARFQQRLDLLGEEQSSSGSFGRMVRLLHEVWRQQQQSSSGGGGGDENGHDDEHAHEQDAPNVHWRDVMQQQGWDDLLI